MECDRVLRDILTVKREHAQIKCLGHVFHVPSCPLPAEKSGQIQLYCVSLKSAGKTESSVNYFTVDLKGNEEVGCFFTTCAKDWIGFTASNWLEVKRNREKRQMQLKQKRYAGHQYFTHRHTTDDVTHISLNDLYPFLPSKEMGAFKVAYNIQKKPPNSWTKYELHES